MDFLNFTGESPSDFPNNRLPTLDCEIFTKNGLIFHRFFEKTMRSGKCLDATSATPDIMLKSSLKHNQKIDKHAFRTAH